MLYNCWLRLFANSQVEMGVNHSLLVAGFAPHHCGANAQAECVIDPRTYANIECVREMPTQGIADPTCTGGITRTLRQDFGFKFL